MFQFLYKRKKVLPSITGRTSAAKPSMAEVPCYVWDLTLRETDANDKILTPLDVHRELRGYCKKWSFQLEAGNVTGYRHYQVRVSFIAKRRKAQCGTWLAKVGWKGHFTQTSKENVDKEAFYCQKVETRLEGPWTEKDYTEPPPKTWQLEVFIENGLKPWMLKIMDMIKTPDMRHINMIVNHSGNKGKSLFVEYMEYEGLAYEAPPINSFDDLMQALHGAPPQACYMVDMPKGMRKEKMHQFFSGIEYLKNGITYDKRYAFKKRRFGRPHIFIFSNDVPERSYVSVDRWALWTIKNDCLEVYKFDDEDDEEVDVGQGD